MQRKQFRIGELAKKLNVERFVIRFWEKEFNIKPTRSDGGQRFYEEKDLNTFKKIKKLLYENGFTINGARQKLKTDTKILGSHKTILNDLQPYSKAAASDAIKSLLNLKQKLTQLKKQL